MYAYREDLEPCDVLLAYDYSKETFKAHFIEQTLIEICENITRKGKKTRFNNVYDYLYEYIEDNINDFLPEVDHE